MNDDAIAGPLDDDLQSASPDARRTSGRAGSTQSAAGKTASPLALDGDALRGIISSIDAFALIILDAAGRVADWNDGARRLFGYATREVVGRSHAMLYSEPERAAGRPELDLRTAAANGGYFEGEAKQRRNDGSEFYGLIHFSRIADGDGRDCAYAMTVRDVTVAHRRNEVLQIMVEQSLNAVATAAC